MEPHNIYIDDETSRVTLCQIGRWCMAEAARREETAFWKREYGWDKTDYRSAKYLAEEETLAHRSLKVPTGVSATPSAYAEASYFGVLPRKTGQDCHAFLSWCAQQWEDASAPGPNHWYGIYRKAVAHFHVAKRTRMKAFRKYQPRRANVESPWKYLLAIMFKDYSCFDDWLLRRQRPQQIGPSEETI